MQRESFVYWLNVQLGVGDLALLLCVTYGIALLIQRLNRCFPTPSRKLAIWFLIPAPIFVAIHSALNAVMSGLLDMGMGTPVGIEEVGELEIARAGKILLLSVGCSLLLMAIGIWLSRPPTKNFVE